MKFYLFVFLFLLGFSMVSAQSFEQFRSYDTRFTFIDKNTIEVEKKIYLRNLHSVGIVPGQIEFKLSLVEGNNFEITNLQATNRYDQEIRSNLRNTATSSSILIDIFTPVLPGFEYEINLKYNLEFENSGILFNRIQLPLKHETRVPILDGNVEIVLPENMYVTYSSYDDEETQIKKNIVNYKLNENSPNYVLVEYSRLPISLGPMAGSLVFWLFVNFILIFILALEIRKELKKNKKKK